MTPLLPSNTHVEYVRHCIEALGPCTVAQMAAYLRERGHMRTRRQLLTGVRRLRVWGQAQWIEGQRLSLDMAAMPQ